MTQPEPTPTEPRTKVLYVLGVYRSGTTVLGNTLGQLDGFFSVGELRALWRELASGHGVCGCGEPLLECGTWSKILARTLGDREAIISTAKAMWGWQQHSLADRHTWLRTVSILLRGRRRLRAGGPLSDYGRGLARILDGISSETPTKVIVDSSKESTDGALLRLLPGVSTYFVHIVRDPRGTVYSGLRLEAGGGPVSGSHVRRSAYAAASWTVGNLAGAAVRSAHGSDRSMLVRYEDFVDDPWGTAQRLSEFVGEPASLAPPKAPGVLTFLPTHTVCGNDNRFRTGEVAFRPDIDWQQHLDPRDRAAISTICSPLLYRYGYEIIPPNRRPQGGSSGDTRRS